MLLAEAFGYRGTSYSDLETSPIHHHGAMEVAGMIMIELPLEQ